jgi:hypothetical protein
MRMQLFSLLEPREQQAEKVNLIGSNLPVCLMSELVGMLHQNGFQLQVLNWCETFEDYMDMAEASLNLVYEPIAIPAAQELKKRLGQDYLYLPFSFQEQELEESYQKIADKLQIQKPDFTKQKEAACQALKSAKELIGDTKIALDYTLTFRILSFTRLLLERGFHVTEVYADGFLPEEESDFCWIREHFPDITITSCVRPTMRYTVREREEKILALGQKAAYFTGTDYFVNVVESGGMYGFDGIRQMAELMKDAYLNKKDQKDIIQRKGYGCESCI